MLIPRLLNVAVWLWHGRHKAYFGGNNEQSGVWFITSGMIS